uniref:Transposable element Tc3 transposase n=1 Tax=Heterorhabditis bacteriophora TaxID=37862 RepID=A0A1I7WLM7_HETBA
MLDNYPNIVRSRMKYCPQLTQEHNDERLLLEEFTKGPRLFSTRNFDEGSVVVWRAFSSLGLVELAFVSTKMNSTDYQNVLASRSNKIIAQSTPIEAPRPGWRTITWTLWTSCRNLNPMKNLWTILIHQIHVDNHKCHYKFSKQFCSFI